MKKILFICHGNICRSPMAEYVFRDMVEKAGLADDIYVESAAVSSEETGNPVHRGTVRILNEMGIDCSAKRARQMTYADYENFDLLIGMDEWNLSLMNSITHRDPQRKIHALLDFCGEMKDIPDPWYSGNFDFTKVEVTRGCEALLRYLRKRLEI